MEATEGRLLVPISDAAKLLGVSERTVFSMTQAGELPSVRVRGRRMYRVASIEQWISDNELLALETEGNQ
ncbi:MAG: helix-turn-helix domain-containing protein [Planctomycetota bacterium]